MMHNNYFICISQMESLINAANINDIIYLREHLINDKNKLEK